MQRFMYVIFRNNCVSIRLNRSKYWFYRDMTLTIATDTGTFEMQAIIIIRRVRYLNKILRWEINQFYLRKKENLDFPNDGENDTLIRTDSLSRLGKSKDYFNKTSFVFCGLRGCNISQNNRDILYSSCGIYIVIFINVRRIFLHLWGWYIEY